MVYYPGILPADCKKVFANEWFHHQRVELLCGRTITLSPLRSAVSLLNVCTVLEAWVMDLIYFHCECTHTH